MCGISGRVFNVLNMMSRVWACMKTNRVTPYLLCSRVFVWGVHVSRVCAPAFALYSVLIAFWLLFFAAPSEAACQFSRAVEDEI